MAEFTGERVIPGEVDPDLWNEHFARYAFASRLARRKRVLDAGCGAGYGSAELGRGARQVLGVDVSREAVQYAAGRFKAPNTQFLAASCTALPFAAEAFDLVAAFELIEHLPNWRVFLEEVRRVLAPAGQCVISTPNKAYYTLSRGTDGANPFHHHEFTFQEFEDELRAVFPHVSMFVQNHAQGIVFHPVQPSSPAEARVECAGSEPEAAHFFLAVCALAPQTGAPTFLYLPRTANLLRERELHIERLRLEIEERKRSIQDLEAERGDLIEIAGRQKLELEERNRWAEKLNGELEEAGSLVRRLQGELEEQARGYEQKVAELEGENAQKSAWGQQLTQELSAKVEELGKCVEALHETEKVLAERTHWAQSLDRRVSELEASLSLLRSSRWMRVGRALGVGPRLRDEAG